MKKSLNKKCLLSLLTLWMCLLSASASSTTDVPRLFPTAADGYWRHQVPAAMRRDYARLAEQYRSADWAPIPDSLFAEFRKNGNRTRFEEASFSKRRQLACLVMGEIMQHKGRFLPAVRRGLHYFMEQEPWWGLPAHYPLSCPERNRQVVDLFNAETASMLAWTVYMLGEDIDREEPGLVGQMKEEIARRFLRPTLYERQGWKRNANNWNTWITSNWLECVMLCETDSTRRTEALKGIHANLRLFLNHYPDDGGCEEGVDYWDRAGASFFESLYFLDAMSAPLPLTGAEQEKVHAMGRFLTTMHIHDLTFVNFSDAKSECLPNINILFPYGAYFNDATMMSFAAYIGRAHNYLSRPSYLFLRTGNFPTLSRELLLLSMLPRFKSTRAAQPQTVDAYLANSQIMVAATAPSNPSAHHWLVAAKGGNNGESHNHNDVGNFIVYYDHRPVIIDLGRDTYTSQTFSARRYEMTNNRSLYHNVPVVNSEEQAAGRNFRAQAVEHQATDTLSMMTLDLAKAYPAGAQVERWTRRIALNRKANRVELSEHFSCRQMAMKPTALTLMCFGQPQPEGEGRVVLDGGRVALRFDARQLSVTIQKVDLGQGILHNQWKDNVYRLELRVTRPEERQTVDYQLETNKNNIR